MSQPESKLSRAIKAMIRARGGYCIKIHGGPTMEAGTPDILACIPCSVLPEWMRERGADEAIIGRFVGIETKTPENNRTDKDGSAIQQYRAAQIRHAGGVVIIPAKSVQQVVEALDALGWVSVPPLRVPGPTTAI